MTTHPHHTSTHGHHKQQDNGLAIASLILGVVSLAGFGALTGIPAIITGFMSLKNPVNKGMGIAGLILGSVATVFTLFAILFFILLVIIGVTSSAPSEQEMPRGGTYDSSHSRSI